MPAPEFNDVIGQEVTLNDDEASSVICRCANLMAKAAYWEGVAEERKVQIDRLLEDQDLAISYLKDRLNRAETPKQTN